MKKARTADTQQLHPTDIRQNGRILGHYLTAIFILGLATALCWCLPPVLMEWQDEKQVGKSYVQPAQPVIATTQEGMTLIERISLIYNNTSVLLDAITKGKSYSTEFDALRHANTELKKLQEAEILETYETLPQSGHTASAYVLFTIDMDNSERSGLFWNGTGENETWRFHWYMDDETGKLISIIQSRRQDIDIWEEPSATDAPGDAETTGNPYPTEEEVFTNYITKWAQYLGCTVQETGRAEQYGLSGARWTEMTQYLRDENYDELTDQELYYEAGQALGYPVDFLYYLHYAILTDGNNSTVYYFNISDDLRFLWFPNENL